LAPLLSPLMAEALTTPVISAHEIDIFGMAANDDGSHTFEGRSLLYLSPDASAFLDVSGEAPGWTPSHYRPPPLLLLPLTLSSFSLSLLLSPSSLHLRLAPSPLASGRSDLHRCNHRP
jgi:hypothetical protein